MMLLQSNLRSYYADGGVVGVCPIFIYSHDILEFEDFVADIVAEVGYVSLVCSEVQQVEDGARGGLDDHLATIQSCSYHLHLYLLRERRHPCPMPSLNDKQVIVVLYARKLRALHLEQMLDSGVGSPSVVGEG